MNAISAVSLFVLFSVCLTGIFSAHYRDNWAQFFGLWGTILWSSARFWDVVQGGSVSTTQLVAHASLALFALGTAYEVIASKRPRKWVERKPVSDDEMHHIYGGKS